MDTFDEAISFLWFGASTVLMRDFHLLQEQGQMQENMEENQPAASAAVSASDSVITDTTAAG